MAEPRFFEDFRFGETFETGTHEVTLDEMVAFARLHDPQSFHTDAAAAERHPVFRGLSASGYYTMTVTHRLILALDPGHAWGLVGKGIDRLRWPRAVRAGDVLKVRGTVTGLSRDPRHPFGILETAIETLNQHDEPVLTMTVQAVVPSRIAAAAQDRRAA
jgi:acyl dehydratase